MTTVRTTRLIAGAALLAALATGCSGGSDGTPATSSTSTSVPETALVNPSPPDVVQQYFDELSSPIGDAGTAAVRLADADRYAEHLRLSREMIGDTAEQPTVSVADGQVDVCAGTDCVVYDQIITDPTTGRLVTFSVDGQPLSGRISGGGLPSDSDGVIARALTAYRSNSGQVLIIVEINNTTDVAIEVFGFAAVLRPATAASGVEAVSVWGEPTIPPGDVGTLLLVFDGDGPEGRLQVNGLREDGIEFDLDLGVPAPS